MSLGFHVEDLCSSSVILQKRGGRINTEHEEYIVKPPLKPTDDVY